MADNKGGRPRLVAGGAVPVTTWVPKSVADTLDKLARDRDDHSVSAVAREFLQKAVAAK